MTEVKAFKVGDTVRVVRDEDEASNVGKIGILRAIEHESYRGDYTYLLHDGDFNNSWWVAEIEAVETFKVGDRIRVVHVYGPDEHIDGVDGEIGTYVGAISGNDYLNHNVRIDGDTFVWAVSKIEHVTDAVTTTTKENDVTVTVDLNELDAVKAELAKVKESTSALIDSLRSQYSEMYGKHNAFRKQVADLAIETYDNGDGPWCKDGFTEAMSTLGLEDFLPPAPFEVTVSITIPAEHLDGYVLDTLDTDDVAAIIYGLGKYDLEESIQDFDTVVLDD